MSWPEYWFRSFTMWCTAGFHTRAITFSYICKWFNAGKTKYLFFHKPSARDSIALRLATITFNSIEIKRESSVKFLGVIVDEDITWNKHTEIVENKISPNIGILYRASHYLDKKSLKSIYFSFIHNYVNYCNIAWAITSRTKLKNFEEIKACCA